VPSSGTLLTLQITQFTLTRDKSYASAGRVLVGPYVVTTVCIQTQEIKNKSERESEGVPYCMVLLLQQYGRVLFDTYDPEF